MGTQDWKTKQEKKKRNLEETVKKLLGRYVGTRCKVCDELITESQPLTYSFKHDAAVHTLCGIEDAKKSDETEPGT